MNSRQLILLLPLLFTACLGTNKVYDYHGKNNLFMHTQLENGVDGYLGIYTIDKACHPVWQGSIELKNGKSTLALKPDLLYYLVVDMRMGGGFFSNSSSSLKNETLLQTHTGVNYSLNTTYQNSLYDVTIRAKNMRTQKVHELFTVPLSRCKPI